MEENKQNNLNRKIALIIMRSNRIKRKKWRRPPKKIASIIILGTFLVLLSISAMSNLSVDENSAKNMEFNEDKDSNSLIKSLSAVYHANNTYLDVTFGETYSDTWNFQWQPGNWGECCYLEHYAVYSGTWGGTKESDVDFIIDQIFEDSPDGRTATIYYENLQITRQIYVPGGDEKHFEITYTLTNTNDTSTLSDVRFFETLDSDIPDTSDCGDDYAWYVDTMDLVCQNDDEFFSNGFTGSKPSSNHGMDDYSTELYSDWDDGELNGNDRYPETGTGDCAVGMQWNVGDMNPRESWEITLTFYFGEVAGIRADAGPDQTVGRGQPVTFDASGSSSVSTITTYEWDFDNDGVYDVSVNTPIYVYEGWTELGEYNVTLRVTDDEGRNDTDTVKITVVPNVDLIVSNVTFTPTEINDGDIVIFNATVENIGTEAFTDDFYVRFEIDGIYIGSKRVAGMAAGSSVEVAQSWVAYAGNHTVTAIVDYYNEIMESNESNNELSRVLPEILFSDLTVTALTWSPPTDIRHGDTVTFTATVENIGLGITSRDFYVRFEIDGIYIGSKRVVGIEAGSSVEVAQSWVAYAGSHNVTAIVDYSDEITESNETNNKILRTLPEVPFPDLTITDVSWLPIGDISDGDMVTFEATVENIGDGATLEDVNVRFEVDGIYIGRQTITGGIAAGDNVNVTQDWEAEGGSHNMSIYVDEYNTTAESNEGNNEKSVTLPFIAFPDLKVTDISWTPTDIHAGDTVTFTATIENVGIGNTSRDFYVKFDVDGKYIGQKVVSGLDSGSSTQVSQTWTATWANTVNVSVDEYDAVAESDETNNKMSKDLPGLPYPDLVVTHLAWETIQNINAGDPVTFNATIENTGGTCYSSMGNPLKVALVVNGEHVGTRNIVGSILTGHSLNTTFTWTAQPGANPQVCVNADHSNIIPESNENNNELCKTLTLVIKSPDLTVTQITFVPTADIHVGDVVEFTAKVENIGEGNYSGDFDIGFYVNDTYKGVSHVTSGLLAGESTFVTFNWTASSCSNPVVKAKVDFFDIVQESNETNNEKTETLPVSIPYADLEIVNITWQPEENIKDRDPIIFNVTVKNNGPENVVTNFKVYFDIDGYFTRTNLISGGLAAGESKTTSFTWKATPGDGHNATVKVDPDNIVSESDETNNEFTQLLPFNVSLVEIFEVKVEPAEITTGIGGQTSCKIRINNHGSASANFDITVVGLDSDWYTLSKTSIFLSAGEERIIDLAISVPDACENSGNFSFQVSVTSRETGITKQGSANLIVEDKPVIHDLLPKDGASLGSDDITFSWKTYINASTKIYLKSEDEADYTPHTSADGQLHTVVVADLDRNKNYLYYAESTSACGTNTSSVRTFYIGNGISFTQDVYEFTVEKDYNQRVTIGVQNTDNEYHELLVEVPIIYDDLVLGFVGDGSQDNIIPLNPGESKDVTLAIHLQDAMKEDYELMANLTSTKGNEILSDTARIKIHVHVPRIDYDLEEISSDNITLTKTFKLTNKGDPITDLSISIADDLKENAYIEPAIEHQRLGEGDSIEFNVVPLLSSPNFHPSSPIPPVGGNININPGHRTEKIVFSVPVDKKVYTVNITNVTWIKHIETWFCNNRPHVKIWWEMVKEIIKEEIMEDPLIIKFTPTAAVQPHDVYISVNGHEIGSLINTVPDGYYKFDVDPSFLNYPERGVSRNCIEINTAHQNGGHYVVGSDMEIRLHLKNYVTRVVASSQEEANQIAVDNLPPGFYKAPESISIESTGTEVLLGTPVTLEATSSPDLMVWATFSNGDGAVYLAEVASGVYRGTWTPQHRGDPSTGNCVITIHAKGAGVQGETTRTVTIIGPSKLKVEILTPEDGFSVKADEAVVVSAQVTRTDNLGNNLGTPQNSDTSVETYIPEGSLTLYDDGIHGDGSANDGLYANVWNPQTLGDCEILVVAVDIKGELGSGSDRVYGEVTAMITLKASKAGYTEDIKEIDNSQNFGSLTISGRVINKNTGDPIAGATVEIISGADYTSAPTDADGSYTLTATVPEGSGEGEVTNFNFNLEFTESTIGVKAFKEGYTEENREIDNSQGFGNIVISGKVTDKDTGNPIEGATIEIISGANYVSATTDANGGYTITAIVPEGSREKQVHNFDFMLKLVPNAEIISLSTDKESYIQGETINVVVELVTQNEKQPVIVETNLWDATGNKVSTGGPTALTLIGGSSSEVSHQLLIPESSETGKYTVEAIVRDNENNVLDKKTKQVAVGGADIYITQKDILFSGFNVISENDIEVNVDATIHFKNVSDQPIEFEAKFYDNTDEVKSETVSMTPGEKTISMVWSPSSPNASITIIIDPANSVKETNEGNNKASKQFSRPHIKEVRTKFKGTFISGIGEVKNTYTAFVEPTDPINNPIKRVKFDMTGQQYVWDTDGSDEWTAEFDMAGLSPGAMLTVTAFDASGTPSKPYILQPTMIDPLPWMLAMYNTFLIPVVFLQLTSLPYDNSWQFSEKMVLPEPGFKAKVEVPKWIPIFGGTTGVEYKFEFGYEFNSKQEFKVFGGGSSNVEAAGNEGSIAVIVSGTAKYEPGKGLNLQNVAVEISGSVSLPVQKWDFKLVEFGVNIIPGLKISFIFKDYDDPNAELIQGLGLGWESGEGTVEFAVEGYGKIGKDGVAGVAATVGGKPSLTVKVPSPYFKEFALEIYAKVKTSLAWWSKETQFSWKWSYPPSAMASGAIEVMAYELSPTDYGWKPLSRDYALEEDYATFLGNDNSKVFLALASTNIPRVREGIVVENVFPHAYPSIAADGTGNALLTWVHDNISKPMPQGFGIYYSIWNGSSWSMPSPITDNNMPEFKPIVEFDANGNAIAIWQIYKNSSLTADTSPFDVLNEVELGYSMWNHTTSAWTPPGFITNNDVYEDLHFLSADENGNIIAAWIADSDNNITTISDRSIYYSIWNGSKWSTPSVAVADVPIDLKPKAAYNGDNAILVWVQDMDNNASSKEDREIFYATMDDGWIPHRVTNDALEDCSPSIRYTPSDMDSVMLLWTKKNIPLENGNDTVDKIHSSTLSNGNWSDSSVVAENLIINGLESCFDSMNNTVIIWRGVSDSGSVDIFYSVRDNTNLIWSKPQQLTNDSFANWLFSMAIDSNDNIILTDIRQNITYVNGTAVTGESDLYYSIHPIKADLALTRSDITFSNKDASPGETVIINANIHNIGDLQADSVAVEFYDGLNGPKIGETQIISSLAAGENETVSVTWAIPAIEQSHDIYVHIDPNNTILESNESNNIAFTSFILPDLTIDMADILFIDELLSVKINTTIHNRGVMPASNVLIQIFDGNPLNGSLIANASIPVIPPDSNVTISTIWDTGGVKIGGHDIHVVVDPLNDIQEQNETNNMAKNTAWILPDLTLNAENITFSSTSDGNVTIDAYISNVGLSTARDIIVQFFDDDPFTNGSLLGNRSIDLIHANSSFKTTITWNATVGTHDIYVLIDPLNSIWELDETNNLALNPIAIMPAADLTIDPASIVFSHQRLSVNILNVGNAYALYTTVQFYDGIPELSSNPYITEIPNLIGTEIISILKSGESQTISTNWTPVNITHDIHVIVDPEDIVHESNESNNLASQTITVTPNQPPIVEIYYPLEGDTISGTVTISGNASDPDGNETLIRVEVRIDPRSWENATGTTSWNYDWDTTTVPNGQHILYARSDDGKDYSEEISITVTVDNPINNPPTVSIYSPSEGATISGTITISGTASDPDEGDSVEKVEVKIDGGSWITASGTTSWSCNWDTTTVSNGQHTIYARSYDGEDPSNIVSRSVTVDNPIAPPNNPPTVSISSPTTGAIVSGTVTITGTASDPDGDETLAKVEVRIDSDSWKTVTGTTSWNYEWDTTTVSNGEHTINARSYDGKDHSEEASITVTVNNPIPNKLPVVSISHPSNGSTVSGTVTISGNASDSDGNETLVRVEIRIDSGNWKNTTGTISWSYGWNTKKTSNGNHTIEVRAWDGINYSSIDSIVLNVQNKKKGGIPGFEIIFLVAAITIVLLWKRKHRLSKSS